MGWWVDGQAGRHACVCVEKVWSERQVRMNQEMYGVCVVIATASSSLFCCAFHYRSEYVFHFDQPFAIHDDVDVLKKMGMAFGLESGTCSDEDLQRAKAMLPKAFEAFLSSKWLYVLLYLHFH